MSLGSCLQLNRPGIAGEYLSIRYTERLAEAGIEPSVGSVGDSYDNARTEPVVEGRGATSKLWSLRHSNG